jgi:putative transposase
MFTISIKSYHIKHRIGNSIKNLLEKAKHIADFAVANKKNKKKLTSKYVKEYGLPSVISNQILRKYGS